LAGESSKPATTATIANKVSTTPAKADKVGVAVCSFSYFYTNTNTKRRPSLINFNIVFTVKGKNRQ
jgi:hypothetical protein